MNSILNPNEKINTFDKNSLKNVDSGGRAALADGKKETGSDVVIDLKEIQRHHICLTLAN